MMHDVISVTGWTEVSGDCLNVPVEQEQQDESRQVGL